MTARLLLALVALVLSGCATDPQLHPPAGVSAIEAALDRPCPASASIPLMESLAPLRAVTVQQFDGVPTDVDVVGGSTVVALRDGRIVADDGTVLHDLREGTSLDADQGLFSVAAHPEGLLSLRTVTDGSLQLTLHRPDPGSTDAVLLRVAQPDERHNGGGLVVHPDTGEVFVGVGDGGGQGGWYLGDAPELGTILRGVVRHGRLMPVDGATDLVWATGLRNPNTLWLDGERIWVADTGESCREEVSVVELDRAAPDFGWNAREGDVDFIVDEARDPIEPVAVWRHDQERCAVVGGTRGPEWLDHVAVVADHCTGELFAVTPDGFGQLPLDLATIIAVDVLDGELHVLLLDGSLVRVDRGDTPSG